MIRPRSPPPVVIDGGGEKGERGIVKNKDLPPGLSKLHFLPQAERSLGEAISVLRFSALRTQDFSLACSLWEEIKRPKNGRGKVNEFNYVPLHSLDTQSPSKYIYSTPQNIFL